MYNMSHHHDKTAGPICPKFCTQIHLGPEMFIFVCFFDGFKKKMLNIFFGVEGALDGIGWDEKGRRGGGDRMVGKGREGEGRGVVVKLLFHF